MGLSDRCSDSFFSYEFFRLVLKTAISRQVSRTLLHILAYLNSAVAWMVSYRSLITFSRPLEIVPKTSVTCVLSSPSSDCIFSSLVSSKCFCRSFPYHLFSLHGTEKSSRRSPKIQCVLFCWIDSGFCIYLLSV